MAVIIGSARSDERGKITGGTAGDQTGKEVSTQNYYVHSKGWRVLRAKDAAKRKLLAAAMKAACANSKIGYDQNERGDLYELAEKVGFDPANVTTACETDCSALVRVCCAYAGIKVDNFNTSTQANILLASGAFTELKGEKYTTQSAYLMAGDILVTKKKGHTVIVLTDGSKAETNAVSDTYKLGEYILRNGSEGDDVAELQKYLIQLGYDCGKWGADGDFGDGTQMALMKFQKDHGLVADGVYGPKSHAVMMKLLDNGDKPVNNAKQVKIVGGNCYVRNYPNTSGKILGVAHAGDVFTYQGQTSETGWYLIIYKDQKAWVSGKYSELKG